VQLAHIGLAKYKGDMPEFESPRRRGDVSPSDVLKAPEGRERELAIQVWAESVLAAWGSDYAKVAEWVATNLYASE
jgi:hypothetical protein